MSAGCLLRGLAQKRDQRAEESLEGRSQDHKDYTLLRIFSPKLFGLPIAVFFVFVEGRGKWRTDGGRWCKRMLNDQLGAWPRFGKVLGETECGSNWSFLARNFLASDVGLFLVSEEVAFDVTGCHARVLLWSVLV